MHIFQRKPLLKWKLRLAAQTQNTLRIKRLSKRGIWNCWGCLISWEMKAHLKCEHTSGKFWCFLYLGLIDSTDLRSNLLLISSSPQQYVNFVFCWRSIVAHSLIHASSKKKKHSCHAYFRCSETIPNQFL